MNYRIGIQFCGGCNPHIDRGSIAMELRDRLADEGYEIVWNRTDCDFVIFISGCTASCAERQSCGEPSIRVAAATVDFIDVAEHEMTAKIIKKVANYFEQLEKSLRG